MGEKQSRSQQSMTGTRTTQLLRQQEPGAEGASRVSGPISDYGVSLQMSEQQQGALDEALVNARVAATGPVQKKDGGMAKPEGINKAFVGLWVVWAIDQLARMLPDASESSGEPSSRRKRSSPEPIKEPPAPPPATEGVAPEEIRRELAALDSAILDAFIDAYLISDEDLDEERINRICDFRDQTAAKINAIRTAHGLPSEEYPTARTGGPEDFLGPPRELESEDPEAGGSIRA